MTDYLILIAYEPGGWERATEQERERYFDEHRAFHHTVGERLLAGEALAGTDTATTLRHSDGKPVLTDGPFAETAEMIGGFYLVRADTLDEVVEWCKLLPKGYALEIRPCVSIDGFEV